MTKVLWVGDGMVATGFARVNQSIINNLPENYEIHHLAVNFLGDCDAKSKKARQYLYPAVTGGDLYGIARLPDLISKIKPDSIFILQDSWVVKEYLDVIPEEYFQKTVLYTPVDAGPYIPSWLEKFPQLKHVVTYTNFGKRVLENANPDLDVHIIPHGVDTQKFFPIPIQVARESIRSIKPNDFIVLTTNRNQPRKKYDVLLKGFALVAPLIPEIKLYAHCGVKDAGWDLIELAKRYNIESRLILSSTKLSTRNYFPDSFLNLIYNASNVGINPSKGEGWGLCLHPDTPITTAEGSVMIKDVKVGSRVYDALGNIEYVTNKYERDYSGILIGVKAPIQNDFVYFTPEHPILTRRGWIKAEELRASDMVFTPELQRNTSDLTIDLHQAIPRLKFTDNYVFFLRNGDKETSRAAVKEYRRKYLGKRKYSASFPRYIKLNDLNMDYIPTGANTSINIAGPLLGVNTKERGLGAGLHKFIQQPKVASRLQLSVCNEIYNYAVWHRRPRQAWRNNYEISSQVPVISEFWRYLLARLRKPYSTSYDSNLPTIQYRVIFTAHDSQMFNLDVNGFWSHINLCTIPYSGKVYNLEVSSTHTYLADFIAVHNCNMEHSMTGRAQIVTKYAANEELYADGRGIFLEVDHYETDPAILTEGAIVKPETIANALLQAYVNRDELSKIGGRARNFFLDPKFQWKNIAAEFVKLFED